jgi:Domain of unknown function (DUF5666)
MSRRVKWAAVMMALLMPVCALNTKAQETDRPAGGRGQYAGMQRVNGVITAVSGPQVTIKGMDGAVYQVVTTDNTRVMHGRGEAIKVADLKVGDGVMAMGNLDAPNKTMHAAMVMSIDAEQMKRMEEAHKQELANLGKTLIAGTVTAIDMDNVTMTVERPDGVSQTIGFDEGTSFRRGRIGMGNGSGFGAGTGSGAGTNPTATTPSSESITLADIRVGDRIGGPGEVKSGRFVAKELTVMTPGSGRRRSGESPGAGSSETSASGTGNQTPPPSSPK